MKIKKAPKTGVHALLADERIRRWTMGDGATVYAAQDIVAVLTDTAHPEEFWADLKVREPYLAHRVIQLEVEPRTVAPEIVRSPVEKGASCGRPSVTFWRRECEIPNACAES